MKTVLIIPRTPDPFREAWEQAAIEAGHVHHVTNDLTGFLSPLGVAAGRDGSRLSGE